MKFLSRLSHVLFTPDVNPDSYEGISALHGNAYSGGALVIDRSGSAKERHVPGARHVDGKWGGLAYEFLARGGGGIAHNQKQIVSLLAQMQKAGFTVYKNIAFRPEEVREVKLGFISSGYGRGEDPLQPAIDGSDLANGSLVAEYFVGNTSLTQISGDVSFSNPENLVAFYREATRGIAQHRIDPTALATNAALLATINNMREAPENTARLWDGAVPQFFAPPPSLSKGHRACKL